MKLPVKDFLSKVDQIRSHPLIWSYLLKKSLMENFILCAVSIKYPYHHHIETRQPISYPNQFTGLYMMITFETG